jgi:sulfur-carrier protein
MPSVQFTANLIRQVKTPTLCQAEGTTVREVLDAVFTQEPQLRSYILDDQNEVRTHVVVFLDGTAVRDRRKLSDVVRPDSEIFVMQALSGG